ncbi:MAG: Ig-like domain-containing protein [Lachnospiraceae bacterium]|nr:Ig-like domain-containing protein [Lachnospiraceae bacterium]
MRKKDSKKIILGTVICAALVLGIGMGQKNAVKAEGLADNPSSASTGGAVSGDAIDPTLSPSPTPVDVSQIKLSKTKAVLMAKKKVTLTISGTTSQVTWKSTDSAIATVSDTGVVKGVKKGSATIEASVDGIVLRCLVTVVPKMTKKDFGKFDGENFISFCQRKGYNRGYAWTGQWKGSSKKKVTYRGIKIGASKAKVKNAYGEFTLKKCKAKDPFTKMKGLKKNKVKTYTDETYGKYRIRFYFNKKKKVVAIIYTCNASKITKKALTKYL